MEMKMKKKEPKPGSLKLMRAALLYVETSRDSDEDAYLVEQVDTSLLSKVSLW